MGGRELKVQSIRNGTVIDHIVAGNALNVLRILGIHSTTDVAVSVVMNVDSGDIVKKDIVKVEDRELAPDEVDKIALIAPDATINIIREHEVAEKYNVELPSEVEGVIECANPNCISNTEEPVKSRFMVNRELKPPLFRCHYCERTITGDDVGKRLLS